MIHSGWLAAAFFAAAIVWHAAPATHPNASVPTSITLHAKDAYPEKICAQIAEQAHCKIGPANDSMWKEPIGPVPTISLNLDHEPFCVAMQRFCTASHTQLCELGNEWGSIWLTPGDGVWDQRDRVAFEATDVYHMHLVNLGSNKEDHNDFLEVTVCFDPRLKVVQFQEPRLTVAQDENGLSLLPDSPPIRDWDSREFSACFCRQLQLARPPHVGKRLAKVQGSLTLRIVTHDQVMTIPDLAKAVGTSIKAGNRKVDVLSFSDEDSGNLHLKITALNGKPAPDGLHMAGQFAYAKIIDGTGKQLYVDPSTAADSDNALDWHGRFQGNGALSGPISLQWDVVTEVREITVPFEFHDLPLPD